MAGQRKPLVRVAHDVPWGADDRRQPLIEVVGQWWGELPVTKGPVDPTIAEPGGVGEEIDEAHRPAEWLSETKRCEMVVHLVTQAEASLFDLLQNGDSREELCQRGDTKERLAWHDTPPRRYVGDAVALHQQHLAITDDGDGASRHSSFVHLFGERTIGYGFERMRIEPCVGLNRRRSIPLRGDRRRHAKHEDGRQESPPDRIRARSVPANRQAYRPANHRSTHPSPFSQFRRTKAAAV
jgi:hypothetical protein